jgi:Zn-dependent protease
MDILSPIITIAVLVYSAILHEIAHGYVAYRLGDPTAKLKGRLTLDPRPHIDPFMSILLPLILYLTSPIIFGGAKPVPVDPFNLRDGRKDLALVSLAGPITNLLLAIIASLLIHLIFPGFGFNEVRASGVLGFVLSQTVFLNLLLAIFNLIPIPPLDGSKVFSLLLAPKTAANFMAMGNIGMLILMFLLFFPIGGFSLMNTIYSLVIFFLSLLGF